VSVFFGVVYVSKSLVWLCVWLLVFVSCCFEFVRLVEYVCCVFVVCRLSVFV